MTGETPRFTVQLKLRKSVRSICLTFGESQDSIGKLIKSMFNISDKVVGVRDDTDDVTIPLSLFGKFPSYFSPDIEYSLVLAPNTKEKSYQVTVQDFDEEASSNASDEQNDEFDQPAEVDRKQPCSTIEDLSTEAGGATPKTSGVRRPLVTGESKEASPIIGVSGTIRRHTAGSFGESPLGRSNRVPKGLSPTLSELRLYKQRELDDYEDEMFVQYIADVQRLTTFDDLEITEIYRVFLEAANGEFLDRRTFGDAFKQFVPDSKFKIIEERNLTGYCMQRVFDLFDVTMDGAVDFAEFALGLAILCKGTNDEKIQFVFDLFDENGDGYISFRELYRYMISFFTICVNLYPEINEDLAGNSDSVIDETAYFTTQAVFFRADILRNNVLSFGEFRRWYLNPIDSIDTKAVKILHSLGSIFTSNPKTYQRFQNSPVRNPYKSPVRSPFLHRPASSLNISTEYLDMTPERHRVTPSMRYTPNRQTFGMSPIPRRLSSKRLNAIRRNRDLLYNEILDYPSSDYRKYGDLDEYEYDLMSKRIRAEQCLSDSYRYDVEYEEPNYIPRYQGWFGKQKRRYLRDPLTSSPYRLSSPIYRTRRFAGETKRFNVSRENIIDSPQLRAWELKQKRAAKADDWNYRTAEVIGMRPPTRRDVSHPLDL